MLAGLLLFASFDRHLWWAAIAALALLLNTLIGARGRKRFLALLVFSMSFWLPHLAWMRVLGVDAWLLLSLLGILPWIALAAVALEKPSKGRYSAFIAAVVVMEQLRTVVPWGGFPWGHIAYSQVDGPLVQLARLGGQALVTGVVVTLAIVLNHAVTERTWMPLVGIASVVGLCALVPYENSQTSIRVAAIQGNVPRAGFNDTNQATAVLNNHVKEMNQFIDAIESGKQDRPALIVWPENAVDQDALNSVELKSLINSLVARAKTPTLIGSLIFDSVGKGPTNSSLLWQPNGSISARYDKVHVVAFGEYLPYRDVLSRYIGRFEQVPFDFTRGSQPGHMKLGNLDFGVMICFEVAHNDVFSEVVRKGASFFAVQSNNSTYALTRQPDQQLAITRFRAVEHQRATVVATTTGASAVIMPSGEVVATAPNLHEATITGDIPLITAIQPTDRWGNWAFYLALCYLIAWSLLILVQRNTDLGLKS